MPENSNAQAVKYCNERLRPAMNRIISGLRTLRQLKAEYVAQGIGALVAGTQALQDQLMDDGSASDGRTRIKGYDVDLAIGQATALLTWIDAQSGLEVALTKPSVNSEPVF